MLQGGFVMTLQLYLRCFKTTTFYSLGLSGLSHSALGNINNGMITVLKPLLARDSLRCVSVCRTRGLDPYPYSTLYKESGGKIYYSN